MFLGILRGMLKGMFWHTLACMASGMWMSPRYSRPAGLDTVETLPPGRRPFPKIGGNMPAAWPIPSVKMRVSLPINSLSKTERFRHIRRA